MAKVKNKKNKKNVPKKASFKLKLLSPASFIKRKVVKQRSLTPHRSFKVTNRHEKKPVKKVAPGRQIIREVWTLIKANKKLFIGLTSIYIVISWLIIGSVSESNFANYKEILSQATVNPVGGIIYDGTLFIATISGSFNASLSELQQFLAGFCAFLFFMIAIWAARNANADQPVTIRQSLYNGMTPFIPLFLILLVIALEFLPAIIGVLILTIVNNQDFINGGVEAMAFAGSAVLLIALSLYFIVSSLVAAVIVTLPNMYPFAALGLAKQMVTGRRFSVLLRLVVLAVLVALFWAIIMLPVIYLDSKITVNYIPLISVSIQILSGLSLLFSTVYLYRLYRNLL